MLGNVFGLKFLKCVWFCLLQKFLTYFLSILFIYSLGEGADPLLEHVALPLLQGCLQLAGLVEVVEALTAGLIDLECESSRSVEDPDILGKGVRDAQRKSYGWYHPWMVEPVDEEQ